MHGVWPRAVSVSRCLGRKREPPGRAGPYVAVRGRACPRCPVTSTQAPPPFNRRAAVVPSARPPTFIVHNHQHYRVRAYSRTILAASATNRVSSGALPSPHPLVEPKQFAQRRLPVGNIIILERYGSSPPVPGPVITDPTQTKPVSLLGSHREHADPDVCFKTSLSAFPSCLH